MITFLLLAATLFFAYTGLGSLLKAIGWLFVFIINMFQGFPNDKCYEPPPPTPKKKPMWAPVIFRDKYGKVKSIKNIYFDEDGIPYL